MAASGAHKCPKSEKLDEAQALAKSCAGRPDFLPCDGLSICATHSHGKCFKLHWCCHLGWCHKYVYQPMTNVCQLPSTAVPPVGSECSDTMDLSVSLAERFLKLAPSFQSPPHLESPKYCVIADLFVDDYIVKRINGKMCYVQRPLPPLPEPPRPPSPQPPAPATPQMPPNPSPPEQPVSPKRQAPAPPVPQPYSEQKHLSTVEKLKGPKMDHCSSPSSSEDSGINALGLHYLESCEEGSEDEEDELSTDGNSSPGSLWDQDDCSLLSPSKSMIEIIEKIETTV
uniref:Chromosome 3 open reading frame 70 n=2 Tax=Poecilia TaxID=8080 RepID=A0A3B3TUM8_9TELE